MKASVSILRRIFPGLKVSYHDTVQDPDAWHAKHPNGVQKIIGGIDGNDTLQLMQTPLIAADILDKFLARNYTHSENIHTSIAFLWGFSCTELGVLSALFRDLTENEAIEHACISKSHYHTVKKHLFESFDLGRKSASRKAAKKSSWSLRETDRFDIICGVNGKVYFPRTNPSRL